MKNFWCILFAFILFGPQVDAQNKRLGIEMDSLMNSLKNDQRFSGSVAIQRGNSFIYKAEFNPLSNGTGKYRIGSISKVYTALIIYQLIQENKLQLNTKLNKYFPIIKYSEEISIEHLLSHTSGIFSITEMKNYYTSRSKSFSRAEILDIINKNKAEYKPGKDCIYSNSNYILLGFIIEDISGKSYDQNVFERISKPLNLNNTYCETSQSDRSKREQSYKYDGETWKKDVDSDPSLPFASGALVSTPEEMCLMISALFQGKIVSDSSLVQMKRLKDKSTGHGLFKMPYNEKIGWGHTGRIDEFRSFVVYFPGDSLSIALTSNGINCKLNDILLNILSIYYHKEFKIPEVKKYAEQNPPSDEFVGNYKAFLFGFLPVAKFRIEKAGSNFLWMGDYKDFNGNFTSLLRRTDQFRFYNAEIKGELVFEQNKKGKINKLKMIQGKMTMKCKRIK